MVLNDVKDDRFYALIWLEREGELIAVDARPSDALALALRHDSPIYVKERVLQHCRFKAASEKVNQEALRQWLEEPG